MPEKPELFAEDSEYTYNEYTDYIDNRNVPDKIEAQLQYAAEEDLPQVYADALARAKEAVKVAKEVERDRAKVGAVKDFDDKDGVSSHKILSMAEPGFGSYCQWIDQVWNHAPDAAPKDYHKDILEKFYQNDPIDFSGFADDIKKLKDAQTTLEDAKRSSRLSLDRLFDNWTGAGARAAERSWERRIEPNAHKLVEQLEDAVHFIPQVLQDVLSTLKDQVREMLDKRIISVAGAQLDVAAAVVRIANQKEGASEADLATAAPFLNVHYGYAKHRSNDEYVSDAFEGHGVEDYIQWDDEEEMVPFCEHWCGEFTAAFQKKLDEFDKLCSEYVKKVGAQWQEMMKKVEALGCEFPSAADIPAHSAPSSGGHGGGSSAAAIPGGGGVSMAGGTSPSGISMPPSGSPGATTPGETTSPDATTPSSVSEPNPVTGEPLKINPETGEPYPIDPETGKAITEVGDEQETLTVRQGGSEISMSEPNDEGEMSISIDTGTGEPMSFKLDFPTEDQGAGAGPADAGSGGRSAGAGAPDSASERSDFGPQGVRTDNELESPGSTSDVHEPGPDGVIHIERDGFEITAERPEGAEGPTVVTVDDGSGEPIAYTLGESSDEGQFSGVVDGAASSMADAEGDVPAGDDSSGPVSEDSAGPTAQKAAQDVEGENPTEVPGAPGTGAAPPGEQEPIGEDTPDPGQVTSAEAAGGVTSAGDAPESGTDNPGSESTSAQAFFSGSFDADADAGLGAGLGMVGESSALNTEAQAASPVGGQGSAALGTAPDGGASSQESSHTGSMRGMGMMGGGMAGAGGQGGDQERESNGYMVPEVLFEAGSTAEVINRISGSLDDETNETYEASAG